MPKNKKKSAGKFRKDEMKKISERIGRKKEGKELPEAPISHENAKELRNGVKKTLKLKASAFKTPIKAEWIKTGVPGFDELLEKGIPKGVSLLIAGGPGSGKTIFALQILEYACSKGDKCLYMTFEESEERLISHMEDFGWNPKEWIKKGLLMIKRFDPFDITRTVEAMLEESKGELLIQAEPLIIPKGFKPDRIVVDSLSAIASAFVGREESYRIYIENLFRFFEKTKATAFLITEIVELAKTLTEEFLADGVIMLYYIKRGNVRERAIEVLKMRGAKHQEKIVAFEITKKGIVVYPDQEVFGEV